MAFTGWDTGVVKYPITNRAAQCTDVSRCTDYFIISRCIYSYSSWFIPFINEVLYSVRCSVVVIVVVVVE